MRPEVSVLLPVRNGERWLQQAIDSILAQNLPRFELIAIDDGSSDRTPDILRTNGTADARVRVLAQPHQGLVAALNAGLSAAQSSLIARLDADDLAAPDRLAQQVAHLRDNPSTVLLGTWAHKIDAAGRVIGELKPATNDRDLRGALQSGNPFVHSSVMFRADIAKELGGYRPAFHLAEDYDLWLRLSERGGVETLPRFLISYRVHASNATSSDELAGHFSVRLAQRSAAMRRNGAHDQAALLNAPPTWREPSAEGAFYEQDAALLRQASTPAIIRHRHALTRGERKASQAALLARLDGSGSPVEKLRVWQAALRIYPPRAAHVIARGISALRDTIIARKL